MSIQIDSDDEAAVGYDRFIGRYQSTVAIDFADFAGVETDQNFGMNPPAHVLDVGCGVGILTSELLTRTSAVYAVDPHPDLVAACLHYNPGVDVRQGWADALPFPDNEFDIVLASLPLGAQRDPLRCLWELSRVARPGGTVAVCAWDTANFQMYDVFWTAARRVDSDLVPPIQSPTAESMRTAMQHGDLQHGGQQHGGVTDPTFGSTTSAASYRDFADFWASVSYPAGPTGAYLAAMSTDQQLAVRAECQRLVPDDGPFVMTAQAVYARGFCGSTSLAG